MSWRLWVAALIAGGSLTCSLGQAADTQRPMRVGFVSPQSVSTVPTINALWDRLGELGWVKDRNLIAEVRSAEGQSDRLPALMNEMVAAKVDVLITVGTPAAVAARNATTTIPIIIAAMGDPVGTGLVKSLAHPGGNLTGLSLEMTEDLSGKWVELLQETVPRLSAVAVISNPDSPLIRRVTKNLQTVASRRKLKLRLADVREPDGLEAAFKQGSIEAQAALILPDPLTMNHVPEITALARKYRLPAMYPFPDFMSYGGRMSYAVEPAALFRRTAEYVDKILRGANPGDLPIEQPTQFKLMVNLNTAKALGLVVPESILLRADEVLR